MFFSLYGKIAQKQAQQLWGITFMRISILTALFFVYGCVSTDAPDHDEPVVAPEARVYELEGEDIIIIGDQGTGTSTQFEVANGIERWCTGKSCDFGIGLGDNFYFFGVRSSTDNQFVTKFEKPYKNLNFPFYMTLGNHDYFGNFQAQLDYTGKGSGKWHMPHRYYKLSTPKADIFILDIERFDLGQQDWLDAEIADSAAFSAPKWRIVLSHRPTWSSGSHGDTEQVIKLILPILKKSKADFYLSGHDHHLEHIQRDGMDFFISGSAGQTSSITPGKYSKFAKSTPGFMYMDFSEGAVDVSFVNRKAEVLYTKRFEK